MLSPEEIHRLAGKVRREMGEGGAGAKAACHSDQVDGDEARRLQAERLVTLG